MSSYTHFTLDERKSLQFFLSQGLSKRKIAAILGRSPSSVTRELKRNGSKNGVNGKNSYHPWRANSLAIMRRRQNARRAILPQTDKWNYVVFGLEHYWSPEEIAGRWKIDNPSDTPIGVSTIYRYLKEKRFHGLSRKTHLRRKGKRIQTRNANYNTIQPDRIIPQWPDAIKERLRIGDFEGDTVYGGVGKGLLVTLVDRKSRYLFCKKILHRTADETKDAIVSMLSGIDVKSISFDNGSEFAAFKEIEQELDTLVYFAEPHKPWQRGTNENTNDILRFFFPKGYDFRQLSDENLAAVVDLINNRPRKCLGWRSPNEIFLKFCVALA